ncbi:MAG: hypothetical protein J2P25_14470 [Nocardiopsaceae bacterium]|nr:hypothetical protein [Nocardiopsaceae bacterium]
MTAPLIHGGRPVPYIAGWTAEPHTSPRVIPVVHRGVPGVGYAIEQFMDRDDQGRLWARQKWAPGSGNPVYDSVHTARQRQTMQHLRCQVCSGSTLLDSGERLWLLGARPGVQGPVREGEVTASPPICPPCARTALESCPHLRRGAVAARVRYAPLWGVAGIRYARHGTSLRPVPADDLELVSDEAPGMPWVLAHRLAVALRETTLVSLTALRTGDLVRS